jgi:hypothetical protein
LALHGRGSIGKTVRSDAHDVVSGAHGQVGTFGDRIECDGSDAQLSSILGIVTENDSGERSNLKFDSFADRQRRHAVFQRGD